ncbi:MAG: hydrogenase maturation protease [Bacteroidales bacterium]
MISDLEDIIRNIDRVLIIGVGSLFRRDDYAGIYICEKLKKNHEIDSLIVENSIENYIGKINKLNPEIILIIDAVNFHREPGYFELTSVFSIFDNTAGTHSLSLKKLAGLIKTDEIYVLGIQPGDISFGTGLSQPVLKSAKRIILKFEELNSKKTKLTTP